MDKEMEFKNKSIKEKVNGSFEMIIVLYVVSVAFAVFLMFAVKIVPSATEYFVLAGGIVVLAIITVCSILATLKRAKMLIHYIVEPVRELSSVAEKISGGELDIEIAYQSEDEIGELAEDFRKTANTLQRIIGDLNHILDAFAKGDYTVKSGCRDAYVGEFDTVHAKLIATTEHVSDALKSIRESSNQVAQGSDQLAVSAQDLAKNATDQAVAVDSLAQSVSEITEQILGTSKSIDIVHDKAKDVGTTAAVSQQKMTELTEAMERISVTSKEIGHNVLLNAVEYHRSSEINLAATDAVLILGSEADVTDDFTYETSKMEAFRIPAGTAVEVYATTLHYAPCHVDDAGFQVAVILPKGTNYPLDEAHAGGEDALLTAKNKWLIGHAEGGLPEGSHIGLIGKNLNVRE